MSSINRQASAEESDLDIGAFALATAFASLVVAACLLISPTGTLSLWSQQWAEGRHVWIVGLVAMIVNVITYLSASRTGFSRSRLWTAGWLAAAAWFVLAVTVWSPPIQVGDVAVGLSSGGSPVDQLARSYESLAASIFFPCVLRKIALEVMPRMIDPTPRGGAVSAERA